MTNERKPIGVVILACLLILVGVIGVGLSISMFIGRVDIAVVATELAIASVSLALANGLYKGKRWAWILGQIVFSILIIFGVSGGIAGWILGTLQATSVALDAGMVVCGVVLVMYVRAPEVRWFFGREEFPRPGKHWIDKKPLRLTLGAATLVAGTSTAVGAIPILIYFGTFTHQTDSMIIRTTNPLAIAIALLIFIAGGAVALQGWKWLKG